MKYTKGPWFFQEYSYGIQIRANSDIHNPDTGKAISQLVALIGGYGLDMAKPTSEEAKANAVLISASPEMFEALEAVANTQKDFVDPGLTMLAIQRAVVLFNRIKKEAGE